MLPKISIITISSPTQKSEDEDSYQWYFPKNSSYFISKTKGKTLVVDENTYKKLNKKLIKQRRLNQTMFRLRKYKRLRVYQRILN